MVWSKINRDILFSFQSVFGGKLGSEMAYQLYKLQTLLLNMYEQKMLTPADPHSPVKINYISTCTMS